MSEDADLYSGGKDTAALPERRMLSIAFAHVPARAIHVGLSLLVFLACRSSLCGGGVSLPGCCAMSYLRACQDFSG